MSYVDKTRLVEDVPDVPKNERWYIWCGKTHKVIWQGKTLNEGFDWADHNGIFIEETEMLMEF